MKYVSTVARILDIIIITHIQLITETLLFIVPNIQISKRRACDKISTYICLFYQKRRKKIAPIYIEPKQIPIAKILRQSIGDTQFLIRILHPLFYQIFKCPNKN